MGDSRYGSVQVAGRGGLSRLLPGQVSTSPPQLAPPVPRFAEFVPLIPRAMEASLASLFVCASGCDRRSCRMALCGKPAPAFPRDPLG